jgi:hypothetical protein
MAYTLKLGFIGVMSRWRRDLDTDKVMSDVLQCETEFHPLHRNIAQS